MQAGCRCSGVGRDMLWGNMADSVLHLRDILAPGECVHLTRAELSRRRPAGLHGHDFHELLWVQNGRVRHHRPGGHEDLVEGDLVFVRPRDVHALQGRGEAAMVVSVTLDPATIDGLGARHPRLAGRLFWSEEAAPWRIGRDGRQLAALNQAALRLERGGRDALAAEAFVLPLCAALVEDAVALPADAPDWLRAACAAAAEPRVFRDGAAGFARVAGRAHPHVSRSLRRHLNQSPTAFINARRMAWAARRLSGSGDSLAEIAAECGIPNLSHFHKLFRAHHGATPGAWRRLHQSEVVQPGQGRPEF